MDDEDAGRSAAWHLENFSRKAGIASPAALGAAFMDTAVARVTDFVRNLVEEAQRSNQQPTPSATTLSSSPVVARQGDDEDEIMVLSQTQPSQRRYLKSDRRSSSVANPLRESYANKKRKLDIIDLTDETDSVISGLTGQNLSPASTQARRIPDLNTAMLNKVHGTPPKSPLTRPGRPLTNFATGGSFRQFPRSEANSGQQGSSSEVRRPIIRSPFLQQSTIPPRQPQSQLNAAGSVRPNRFQFDTVPPLRQAVFQPHPANPTRPSIDITRQHARPIARPSRKPSTQPSMNSESSDDPDEQQSPEDEERPVRRAPPQLEVQLLDESEEEQSSEDDEGPLLEPAALPAEPSTSPEESPHVRLGEYVERRARERRAEEQAKKEAKEQHDPAREAPLSNTPSDADVSAGTNERRLTQSPVPTTENVSGSSSEVQEHSMVDTTPFTLPVLATSAHLQIPTKNPRSARSPSAEVLAQSPTSPASQDHSMLSNTSSVMMSSSGPVLNTKSTSTTASTPDVARGRSSTPAASSLAAVSGTVIPDLTLPTNPSAISGPVIPDLTPPTNPPAMKVVPRPSQPKVVTVESQLRETFFATDAVRIILSPNQHLSSIDTPSIVPPCDEKIHEIVMDSLRATWKHSCTQAMAMSEHGPTEKITVKYTRIDKCCEAPAGFNQKDIPTCLGVIKHSRQQARAVRLRMRGLETWMWPLFESYKAQLVTQLHDDTLADNIAFEFVMRGCGETMGDSWVNRIADSHFDDSDTILALNAQSVAATPLSNKARSYKSRKKHKMRLMATLRDEGLFYILLCDLDKFNTSMEKMTNEGKDFVTYAKFFLGDAKLLESRAYSAHLGDFSGRDESSQAAKKDAASPYKTVLRADGSNEWHNQGYLWASMADCVLYNESHAIPGIGTMASTAALFQHGFLGDTDRNMSWAVIPRGNGQAATVYALTHILRASFLGTLPVECIFDPARLKTVGLIEGPERGLYMGQAKSFGLLSLARETEFYEEGNAVATWYQCADRRAPGVASWYLLVFAYRPIRPGQPIVLWGHKKIRAAGVQLPPTVNQGQSGPKGKGKAKVKDGNRWRL
jgi:hypothetical protein